jgi:hypothetical protein
MLNQLSLITFGLALTSALPTDFLGHPIVESIPRDIHTGTLSRRQENVIQEVVAGIYICTGEHWTGNCYWQERVPNYCHKYHLGSTSSFGPDMDVVCALYDNDSCAGVGQTVAFPGFAGGLKGDVKSWMCD